MISEVLAIGSKLIDKLISNPDEQRKAKVELLKLAQSGELDEMQERSKNVRSEIQGESWLQRNWRPITMLAFTSLVIAHWLGFTASNLSENQILALLDIVQVGLGGYVLGRSGEKIMKVYKNDK